MDKRRDRAPGAFAWTLALVSLVLPWLGVGAAIFGALRLSRGLEDAWLYVAAGLALLVLDITIDLIWAHPSISRSDEPALNARAAQLIGRTCEVVEPIRDGRGRVRIGDGEWAAEGADAAAGARLLVVGARGTVLAVAGEPPRAA